MTLILTGHTPPDPDIPEALEACLRVLFSGCTPSSQHIFSWTYILLPEYFSREHILLPKSTRIRD